ncbi:MAG: hypothetical protein JNM66_05435 [Bryobacterales bacterium]|nr:hypothetical protein [Bryobacterales bacterium]
MKLILLLAIGAVAAAMAAPFQYSLSAPAISTGPVTGDAFSLTVTLPNLLPGNLAAMTNNPTLNIPNPINAGYPVLIDVVGQSTGIFIRYSDQLGHTLMGVASPGFPITQPGTYNVNWNLIRTLVDTGVAGNSVTGTLTITNTGVSAVPEPSAGVLSLFGLLLLGPVALRVRGGSGGRKAR